MDHAVAVVIPAYGHPVLLVDAVESVLAQNASFGIAIVIVNDGCPYEETNEVGITYARIHSDCVTYLKKENGGLASARNYGINFIISHMPTVRAIYFLDADNRLRPNSLSRAMAALDADQSVSWIYPDIDMVGLRSSHDYSGPYSLLLHTAMNVCDAGSLIRRIVFESGTMFDPNFHAGFEDWDFFLSAAELGFRGKNIEGFGFMYRKRPESMLAGSERIKDLIIDQLHQKHRTIFSPRNMLQLEQKEAPRYSFGMADLDEIWLTTDPNSDSDVLSLEEYTQRFWASRSSPGRYHLPPFTVLTSSEVLGDLLSAALLHGALWQMETALEQVVFVGLFVTFSESDQISIKFLPQGRHDIFDAQMLMVATASLAQVAEDWNSSRTRSLGGVFGPEAAISLIEVQLPRYLFAPKRTEARSQFFKLLNHLHDSKWAKGAVAVRDWRIPDLARRRDSHLLLRSRLGFQTTLPMMRGSLLNLGLLLPIVEFGGVEKVALNMARSFSKLGYSIHLFVLGRRDAKISPAWRDTITSLVFFSDGDYSPWGEGKQQYFGTEVPRWAVEGSHASLIALLHWLDVVVDLHSGSALSVFGRLRSYGVVTVTSLHLADLTHFGRPCGSPFLSLAYEHAIDVFAPCSITLGTWLHAIGVPDGKVVPVPNAPSFDISQTELTTLLDTRDREVTRNLRVLYIGRLDAQKGLDKLGELIDLSSHLPVTWRVIGGSIIATDAKVIPESVSSLAEPPLVTSVELIQAFAQADVLVLLSEYEGLPLTVLEAMRQGVIPIATSVGAMSEVVTHGVDGYLVSKTEAVYSSLKLLEMLARDQELRRRVSKSAALAVKERSWDCSVSSLDQRIRDILNRRQERADFDLPRPSRLANLSPDYRDFESVNLTPLGWTRAQSGEVGLFSGIGRYEAFEEFIQFGSPDESSVTVQLELFSASQFSEAAVHVLSLTPKGPAPKWFTYELILSDVNLIDFVAIDWHIRYSLSRPQTLHAKFMLDGGGEYLSLEAGALRDLDMGSNIKLSLPLVKMGADLRSKLKRIRLVLATDGAMVGLDLINFSVVGLR